MIIPIKSPTLSTNQKRNNIIEVSGTLESEEDLITFQIKENFFRNPNYTQVTKNSDTQTYNCIIYDDNITDDKDLGKQKLFISYPYSTIQFAIGDYISYEQNGITYTWLITTLDKKLYYNVFGTIQLCTQTLNFYDENHILYQIPCVVLDKQNINTQEDKYLTTIDCDILVLVANNQVNNLISPNEIFKIGRWNYYVTKPDDITKPGLIVLPMKFSEEEQIEHVYTLTILNGNSIQISQSQSLTINCILTDNGEIVDSPSLLYISSDEEIATINSSGLVTILSTGNVVFTVKKSDDLSISDSISAEILEDEQHNYTIEIKGQTINDLPKISIVKNYTESYSCVFKDNGNMIIDQSVFYLTSDDGVSPTTLAEIVSQDAVENICIIKGLELGYVKLFVKNVSETIISEALRIQIENLF